MFNTKSLYLLIAAILCVGILANLSFAQEPTATLRGQIVDQQNAIIVGVTVEAVSANGQSKTAVTDSNGEFVFKNLIPGKYTIHANQTGFGKFEKSDVEVKADSKEPLKITLEVEITEQVVNVADESPINTNPEDNVGSLTIKGDGLDALPDNPDELEAALKAMAGPGAGPDGGQIIIDGTTGGSMPSKANIREIRINSNPFSAEYDKVGFGRIEIFTKPGSDKFHGQANFNFNDESMNSRNPFAGNRAPYQSRSYGANLSGPISKKASFFVDFDRRAIDDLAVINANILDSNLNIVPFSQSVQTPLVRTSFSPRIDYQLNDFNTLTARYSFSKTSDQNNGIGGFSLASRAYNSNSTEQNLQLTETAVINKSIINETRFQFVSRNSNNTGGDSTSPTIQVLDAFTSGGSGIGASSNNTKRWELSNNTSWTIGQHSLKVGARLRGVSINDVSENNFAGTYTFTSLDQYRNVLLGVPGVTPTQFTLTAGNSQAKISQIDFGAFAQDDWRIRPNLTLNFGLRYEAQSNVSNNKNFAPRFGFAWSPDYANGRNGKTVIRGGFGIFYDRINESLSLRAERYDGNNLQSFIVTDPALLSLYPNIPSVNTLLAFANTQNTYRLADNIRSPYIAQTNIGVERLLPLKLSLAVNYVNTRGFNQLRIRNVNAPLNGVRPLGEVGNIFEYESNGKSQQNQLMVNLRSNFSRKYNVFAMYMLGSADSDTDGSGSFPANQYDLSGEYGRSALDTRHRFTVGGNVMMPFGFNLSPFVIFSSGKPFNITTGLDTNGDSLFTERPTYVQLNAKCNALGLTNSFCDINGVSDVNAIIPRNYGTGPSFATVNVRLSKTFGFGGEANGGGNQMGGGMRGGGFSTAKKYNLTFSLNAQNLFNNVNAGNPIGNLSSRLFGQSNSIAGGFGFGPAGSSSSSSAFNRKIEAQIRFSF
ncbi:MAG: TonB-dependent receptor [Pyrinomonadaceae bacterium]|nr:TonB-dependent receptor [Pyrinomonadaceae bacterium]